MSWSRVSISLTAAAALTSLVIAGSATWLLLTRPAVLASAIDEGSVTPLVRQLAQVLLEAVQGLLAYL